MCRDLGYFCHPSTQKGETVTASEYILLCSPGEASLEQFSFGDVLGPGVWGDLSFMPILP